MQSVNLTNDELWQAIAHNTTAMSALVGGLNWTLVTRAMMSSNARSGIAAAKLVSVFPIFALQLTDSL